MSKRPSPQSTPLPFRGGAGSGERALGQATSSRHAASRSQGRQDQRASPILVEDPGARFRTPRGARIEVHPHYNSLVPHPKILARGLLLVIALLALMAAPMAFAPAETAQPGGSMSAAPSVTPEYAGAHMARLQPAPQFQPTAET